MIIFSKKVKPNISSLFGTESPLKFNQLLNAKDSKKHSSPGHKSQKHIEHCFLTMVLQESYNILPPPNEARVVTPSIAMWLCEPSSSGA